MTYSPSQFQRGLSMVEFQRRYGTEEKCAEAMFASRWPKGFVCPECGGRACCVLAKRGLYQCNACHAQTSLTAGTIFHGTHLPLSKWFLAMHLLTQGKHSISGLELMRHLGVSYETAWNVKHKLMQVMLDREKGRVLSGRVEVDDAYMGGERHDGTTGRGTSGRTPFLAAVQTTPDGAPSGRKVLYLKLTRVRNFKGRTVRAWAKRSLATASHVLTDRMAGFQRLGVVLKRHEMKVLPGGWQNSKHPAFAWVNTVLGNLKGSLLGVCRWVSARHLPRYLAEFQWRFNRRFDLASILQRLLRAATLTPPMPHKFLVLAEPAR
jgi:ribosomal protein L37AE/L43A/transposase-like protein